MGMEEGALCFLLCYLYYVPNVTDTGLRTACNKYTVITSHFSLLSSSSVAVSFWLLGRLQVSGVLGVQCYLQRTILLPHCRVSGRWVGCSRLYWHPVQRRLLQSLPVFLFQSGPSFYPSFFLGNKSALALVAIFLDLG